MITTEQHNELCDTLEALLKNADNAGDLYGLMIGISSTIAQRAFEIRSDATPGTEKHNFAIQAHKDATFDSESAERMYHWYMQVAE